MLKPTLFICLCFFSLLQGLRAQLCTGSLGDPVIKIDFGQGTAAGGPLKSSTTSYTYTANSCPNDGEYTVTSQTANCFGNSWHTILQDHSLGDQNGYFMLVNASFLPGDFYLDTVKNLCPGTSYEFAAWVTNVLRSSACSNNGIKPNLSFSIETTTGTVLTTYNTGDINQEATMSWKQYGTFFQTPSGVSDVVVRLTNNAPGGCGNDLALDDITFRPCGPQVTASVGPDNTNKYFTCENEAHSFYLSTSFSPGVYPNPAFQWQVSPDAQTWIDIPGATAQQYLRPPTATGTYFYRMLIADGGNINNTSCRLASNTITIEVVEPSVQIKDTFFGCANTDILLQATGGTIYNWSGPAGFQSTSQQAVVKAATAANQGRYLLSISDEYGCMAQDSTYLIVHPAPIAQVNSPAGVCEGNSIALLASGGTHYQWTPANSLSASNIANPIASPADTTIYTVAVFNDYGCASMANTRVDIWRKPVADAGPDKKLRKGYSVLLDGTISGTHISYYWTPSMDIEDPQALKPLVKPTQTTRFVLHAVSDLGCGTATGEVKVTVFDKMLIPNAFSPNGDGINDLWVIEPISFFATATVQVFNRYGQLVYSGNGLSAPWDGKLKGKPLPVGTYYYTIDLKQQQEPLLSGSVLLIR